MQKIGEEMMKQPNQNDNQTTDTVVDDNTGADTSTE
jgi:hypothetical protein